MEAARWIYLIAGVYGIAVLTPSFFISPPADAQAEFYYGFLGLALVWQFGFILISRDPARFRPLMPITILEKLSFFATCIALYASGRMGVSGPFIGGMIDGVLMVLFAFAWRASRPAANERG